MALVGWMPWAILLGGAKVNHSFVGCRSDDENGTVLQCSFIGVVGCSDLVLECTSSRMMRPDLDSSLVQCDGDVQCW